MTTLKIHALTTAAVLIAAFSQPAIAATRAPRADTPQASQLDQVRRDYYDTYGYARGQGEFDRAAPSQQYPSQNLPYPDRPYGDPDQW
jgi:hypothetical protein